MLKIRDVMTRKVLTVPAEATAEAAAWALVAHNVSGAPVRDRNGKLLGVLSKTDLIDPDRAPPEALVEEVMTPFMLALRPDDSALDAARLMAHEGVHRILVLEGERLVGIVTTMDLVRALARGLSFDAAPDEEEAA
ncbi:MAG TPA: CBS domain-containing protein [Polyangia bacterium]|nr:CBS domain-containing protein [Polyangia bacterium]